MALTGGVTQSTFTDSVMLSEDNRRVSYVINSGKQECHQLWKFQQFYDRKSAGSQKLFHDDYLLLSQAIPKNKKNKANPAHCFY